MATENVFGDDFERLLAPVSADMPTGIDLRKAERSISQSFFDVRDARNKASKAEKMIREFNMLTEEEKDLEHAHPEPPNWDRVKTLAIELLATQSKDLWVASWLIEALAREDGFAGVRDGYQLVRELCERYWDTVHPRPGEGEDLRQTLSQLAGLNGEGSDGTLVAPICRIPITRNSAGEGYTSADYLDAADLANKDPMIRNKRVAQGVPTLEIFERAVNETPAPFYVALVADIAGAINEFKQLTVFLDDRCGKSADGYSLSPPSSNISNVLDDCLSRVKHVGKAKLPANVLGDESRTDGKAVATSDTVSSSVQDREEAFRALLRVADFFRRTEPHSPVSYALEQAVRWGRMPLPELMAELVTDESARRQIFLRTGIDLKPKE
jgi:type VI secretion system protein ImpA